MISLKKIFALVLVIALCTSLAACAKRAEEAVPESSVSEATSSVSEAVPVKPTAAQAAEHNAAIDANNVQIIQFNDPDPGDKIALIKTSAGDIKVRLFGQLTPKTVETFVKLAGEGYYNGQQFTEIVEGYKIEGGGKADDNQYPEEKEFSLDLWNFRGAVALSNSGTNFMIVQANQCLNPKSELEALKFPQKIIERYEEVGGAPHQDWQNPVFGQVVEGMEIVDKISATKTSADGKPAEPVIISEIKIEVA